MGKVKDALAEKFIDRIEAQSNYASIFNYKEEKNGIKIEFELPTADCDPLLVVNRFFSWNAIIDAISDLGTLKSLSTSLDVWLEKEMIEHGDGFGIEDPFTSGELVFDSDGRVHFASDLPD